MSFARARPLLLVSLAASCGGSGPTDPGAPTPPPGTPVSAVVFYDENANGALDANEAVRLPGVTVTVGTASGQSGAGGRAVVANVPAGQQMAGVRPDSLPTYFVPGTAVPVSVPQAAGSEAAIPVQLSIGGNRPNVYMAFGDSITAGTGSNDGSGYRSYLSADLRSYWGGGHDVVDEGVSGSRSDQGDDRMGISLARRRPAFSLILYGTNDWNRCANEVPCFTIDRLRSMIHQARDHESLPVLGTIPPVNPLFLDRNAEERNDWVRRMNERIGELARQERVPLADIHQAFLQRGDLPGLFADFNHPNEAGYVLMSQAWFRALTQPVAGASVRAVPVLLGAVVPHDPGRY